MKPDPIPAIPNLMVLLCIIGGIMRGKASQALAMQFLTISTMVPQLRWLISAWMDMEAAIAAGDTSLEAPFVGDDDPEDELRAGWLRQDGDVWLWQHVTEACAMIIPIQMVIRKHSVAGLKPRPVWSPSWVLEFLSFPYFLKPVLDATPNCALIVPVS